jgi:hypothetical protein
MRSEDMVAAQRSGGGAAGVALLPPHAASAASAMPTQAETVFGAAIERQGTCALERRQGARAGQAVSSACWNQPDDVESVVGYPSNESS